MYNCFFQSLFSDKGQQGVSNQSENRTLIRFGCKYPKLNLIQIIFPLTVELYYFSRQNQPTAKSILHWTFDVIKLTLIQQNGFLYNFSTVVFTCTGNAMFDCSKVQYLVVATIIYYREQDYHTTPFIFFNSISGAIFWKGLKFWNWSHRDIKATVFNVGAEMSMGFNETGRLCRLSVISLHCIVPGEYPSLTKMLANGSII